MAVSTDQLTDTTGIRLTKDAFVVIVRTEWNAHVIDILEEGCKEVLLAHDVKFSILEVPGAVEIPFAVKQYWESSPNVKPDAFIALGCVIRGDTPHFEYVCSAVTQGIMTLTLQLPVPVIFGVLTVNNQMQADERTGGRHGHKGKESAAAALKMIALNQSLQNSAL